MFERLRIVVVGLLIACAAHAAAPPLRTLWSYDKELGLSPQQVTALKGAIAYMRYRLQSLKAQQESRQKAVNDLIKADAEASAIRARARELLESELELRMLDIETAQKMKRTLSPAQLAKWRGIQAQQRAADAQSKPRR